jgi:hypothetical protein
MKEYFVFHPVNGPVHVCKTSTKCYKTTLDHALLVALLVIVARESEITLTCRDSWPTGNVTAIYVKVQLLVRSWLQTQNIFILPTVYYDGIGDTV